MQTLGPLSVADLVLRAMLITGFTCFFRPNTDNSLKWSDLSFEAAVDEEVNVHVEVVVAVPNLKAMAYAVTVGGLARLVKLRKISLREMCVVRILVALEVKMGVFDLELRGACERRRFVVKPTYLDWFVFPSVEGGILTSSKTVSG